MGRHTRELEDFARMVWRRFGEDRCMPIASSLAFTTLLVLTLFVSTLTLGTGRTTVLQGAIHLIIFAAFLLISAVP